MGGNIFVQVTNGISQQPIVAVVQNALLQASVDAERTFPQR